MNSAALAADPAVNQGPVPELSRRDLRGFTADAEKRLLIALARRLPAWVSPDHLTALGVFSMAGAGLCYRLAPFTSLALVGVNAFLFLNWFGDSLDGTLARVREKQRPRYGFYLDHLVDAFGSIFLLGGLASSGLLSPLAAGAVLVAYLLLQIHIALKAHTVRVFQIAFGGIGGTEARLVLGAVNLILVLAPLLQWMMTPLAWTTAAAMVALVVVDGAKTAIDLDREERKAWAR